MSIYITVVQSRAPEPLKGLTVRSGKREGEGGRGLLAVLTERKGYANRGVSQIHVLRVVAGLRDSSNEGFEALKKGTKRDQAVDLPPINADS
jgi:hypothetical protein